MDLKELRKEIDDFDFLTSDTDTELLKIELLYNIATQLAILNETAEDK